MKTFIKQIKENEDVDSCFLVKEKSSSMTKTGNAYLKLKLGDQTGEMEARIWSGVDAMNGSFEKNDFVRVKARAVSFQDHLQLNITHIERIGEETIDLSDFFPMTEKNIDTMFQALMDIGTQVKNPHLQALLKLFWEDDLFVSRFKKAPASKQLHHTHLGGLLEHSLSVAQLVIKNSSHYEGLDLDILLVSSILHDLGKVSELYYDRSFDYTDEGRLIGHIILGIEMVDEKIRKLPDFPKELSHHLKHLLLSHHGQYIWGSPKKPMSLEAVMLHFLDDMDAKINGIRQFLKDHLPEGSRWSSYHPMFEQFFFVPGPQISDQKELFENIEIKWPEEG
jgi:3'-5' exoribonuclease